MHGGTINTYIKNTNAFVMPESEVKDIRNSVEESRSFLKKIELVVPGFAGYREKEDIRTASELLRKQMGSILENALNNLKNARQCLVNCSKVGELNRIAMTISNIETFRNLILNAEEGYSGIAPTIKVNDSILYRLYEYDYGFVTSVKALETKSLSLDVVCDMNDNQIVELLSDLDTMVNSAKKNWQSRIETVEFIKVS